MRENGGNESRVYKSPGRKLIKFFEESRNKWKVKTQESKKIIKRQKNRINFLQKSKKNWKERARALEAEVLEIRAVQDRKDEEIEVLKKKL
jgi:hypothetical protein